MIEHAINSSTGGSQVRMRSYPILRVHSSSIYSILNFYSITRNSCLEIASVGRK